MFPELADHRKPQLPTSFRKTISFSRMTLPYFFPFPLETHRVHDLCVLEEEESLERRTVSGMFQHHLFSLQIHRCSIPKDCLSKALICSVGAQSPTCWSSSMGGGVQW